MEPIKLVVWDLDDTFWKGTLSEEAIEINPQHLAIVRKLTDRGIVNTICSKNDHDQVRDVLRSHGIWDLFVFPSINWEPKGPRIAELIAGAGLRSVNVLFLDDNGGNRREAQFYSPGIEARGPWFIEALLDAAELQGKDDRTHSRLRQYRHVEKRTSAQKDYEGNESFLRDSQIRVSIDKVSSRDLPRVHELIQRTNQLNYTKCRASEAEIRSNLDDPSFDCRCVSVVDRYGDYGVVGFCMCNKTDGRLKHFLFSCRVLNMGIEAFVYDQLGKPRLDVVGDVATPLSQTTCADWIELRSSSPKDLSVEQPSRSAGRLRRPTCDAKVLLKGGCDLSQLDPYLRYYSVAAEEEFNQVNEGNHPVHREHSTLLRGIAELPRAVLEDVLRSLPFLDHPEVACSRVFGEEYDVLVYSVLMDYVQDLFLHKESGIKVPLGGYGNLVRMSAEEIESLYRSKKRAGIDRDFVHRLRRDFTFLGQIQPHEFQENLEAILAHVSKPVVFVNGCEVKYDHPREVNAHTRHRVMNEALDDFIARHPDCHLLDVRGFITERDQLTTNIRHYRRDVYAQMARKLVAVLEGVTERRMRVRLDAVMRGAVKRALAGAMRIVRPVRN